jgi:hypothetical protein
MPSKGTPVTTVRIGKELMERIEAQIASLVIHSPRGDWTVGEFIRVAIEEKLRKMRRSRRRRNFVGSTTTLTLEQIQELIRALPPGESQLIFSPGSPDQQP